MLDIIHFISNEEHSKIYTHARTHACTHTIKLEILYDCSIREY